jgi:non-specific serine/threonine protein kinase/serine/threonine-protein kinase
MTIPLDGNQPSSSDPELTQASSSNAVTKEQIGPYRLMQLLGEGGMGEVWLAEQTTPVHRQVALKIIKAGMDSAQVVARFEAERQALALMDHPAIARVFDAGTTPLGRPYFVMEYVRGEPLTKYCDVQRLSTRERLDLFIQLCEGVQHAHQKGVIHRDLKPSNILVTLQADRPVPKIIDFGLRKQRHSHSLNGCS